MISSTLVELLRWQFALTALLHFLFVPLTLGLSLLVAIAETIGLLTGRAQYRAVSRFWGRLLVIGFVLALVTRLGLLFQFGMNGGFLAQYVGDVLALPLFLEAVSSFFLASGLLALFWLAGHRLSGKQHVLVSWLLVLALHGSAYWVLMANSWMQDPQGAVFNDAAMRIELSDFWQMAATPLLIGKLIHTLAASHLTSALTVLGISAWLLLKHAGDGLARRSFSLAAVLGLLAGLLTVGLADVSYPGKGMQQAIKQTAMLGEDSRVFLPQIETRIRNGVAAHALLEQLRDGKHEPGLRAAFAELRGDLGYGLLVKPWHEAIVDASDAHIKQAAQAALPGHPQALCWAFRLMIALGLLMLLLSMMVVCYLLLKAQWLARLDNPPPLPRWLLKLCLYLSPLPWLANVLGWWVAEVGKLPWAVAEVLPSFLSFSALSIREFAIGLAVQLLVYAALLFAGLRLAKQCLHAQQSATELGEAA